LAKVPSIDALQIVADQILSPSTVQSEALSDSGETVRKVEVENAINTEEHTEMEKGSALSLQSEVDLKLVLGFDHCVDYEAHGEIESSNTTAPAPAPTPTASGEVELASIDEFPVSHMRSNLGKPSLGLALENHNDTACFDNENNGSKPDDFLSSFAELEQKSHHGIFVHNVIRVEWRNNFTGLETEDVGTTHTQNDRFTQGIAFPGLTVEGQLVSPFDNWPTSTCSFSALAANQNAGTASIKPLRQCTLASHFDRAVEEHKHPFNAHSGGAISFDTADPNCTPPPLHAFTTDVLCASDHYDGSKSKWDKPGNSTTFSAVLGAVRFDHLEAEQNFSN
jgi:hypothetical protein